MSKLKYQIISKFKKIHSKCKIEIVLNQILSHQAWTGLGVLVTVLALIFSIVQNKGSNPLTTNEDRPTVESRDRTTSKEVLKKIERSPVFVSQRIALVVGNANYNGEQSISTRGINITTHNYIPPVNKGFYVQSLKNPINDAKSVIKLLKKKKFKIIKGFDLTKENLVSLVQKFQTILSTGGIGVFYYAGHAINVRDNDFLLPIKAKNVSTEEKFINEAVNVTEILRPVEKIIEQHPRNTGSIVIYSASRGGLARDGVGANSPFTKAFLYSLEISNKSGLFEVFISIAKKTSMETSEQQIPWFSGFTYSDFFFNDQAKDKDISLMKILFIDACRDNPFKNLR